MKKIQNSTSRVRPPLISHTLFSGRQSRAPERPALSKLSIKRSGDARKDDRMVKHHDTAADLVPFSLPTHGKAINPAL